MICAEVAAKKKKNTPEKIKKEKEKKLVDSHRVRVGAQTIVKAHLAKMGTAS